MLLVVPIISENLLNDKGYNKKLDDLDNGIRDMAESAYRNLVFGFKEPVDLDFYEILCEQREVLLNQFMGCNCPGCNC